MNWTKSRRRVERYEDDMLVTDGRYETVWTLRVITSPKFVLWYEITQDDQVFDYPESFSLKSGGRYLGVFNTLEQAETEAKRYLEHDKCIASQMLSAIEFQLKSDQSATGETIEHS